MHIKILPSNSLTIWICQEQTTLYLTTLHFFVKTGLVATVTQDPKSPCCCKYLWHCQSAKSSQARGSRPYWPQRITVLQSALKKQLPKAYWSLARYSSEVLQGFDCNASHQCFHKQCRLKSKRGHLQYPPHHTWMNCKVWFEIPEGQVCGY